ncbi:MAG TPA: YbhB/YbcL family Raf kinase inhibitor-like protein [Vicinamibacterales bacterium]|nr:YbhB/YbcL family Raf kinase inhibitor-like protein [Vicinamibacterales bacterium]
MKRVVFALSALLLLPASAFATWSVIAVDRETGRVVISSATCVDRDDQFLMGVQAVVVPGKGVAACQAAVDGSHKNQMLVFQELQKGTDPKQIIAMLSQDPAFQGRQFGILDLQGRSAGHSGLTNGYVSQDVQGQVPGTQIFYSIQGNILRPGNVVPNAVQAFIKTTGTITDRVMAAMEAADGSGGDSRCNCPPWPSDGSAPAIPCDGRTSTVAYILAADPKDTSGDSHNNGKYSMYLTTSQPGPDKGPYQIKAGENLNPVKTLRMRYDAWKKTNHAPNTGLPNPLPPAPAPQGGGNFQNRRGPIQTMTLTTTAWSDGGTIPVKYTQAGEQVSPPLAWGNVPDGTTHFVLIAHDTDAPVGQGTDDMLHWMLWNIPGSVRSLAEAIPQGTQLADGTRQISASGPYYRGPGAPATGPPHHYVFEIYALDAPIDVPAVGQSPQQTRAAVEAALAGKIRARGTLVGLFKRN